MRAGAGRRAAVRDVTGFVVLQRPDGTTRRIPFWYRVARIRLALDRAMRFRVSVRVAAYGRSLDFVTDFVALQAGRGIAFVGVAAIGKPPLDEVALARRVATRLA